MVEAYHLHRWRMDENVAALDLHQAISDGRRSDADVMRAVTKDAPTQSFGIVLGIPKMDCAPA